MIGEDDLPDVAMQAEPIQVLDAAEEKPWRFATEEVVEDEPNTGLPAEQLNVYASVTKEISAH